MLQANNFTFQDGYWLGPVSSLLDLTFPGPDGLHPNPVVMRRVYSQSFDMTEDGELAHDNPISLYACFCGTCSMVNTHARALVAHRVNPLLTAPEVDMWKVALRDSSAMMTREGVGGAIHMWFRIARPSEMFRMSMWHYYTPAGGNDAAISTAAEELYAQGPTYLSPEEMEEENRDPNVGGSDVVDDPMGMEAENLDPLTGEQPITQDNSPRGADAQDTFRLNAHASDAVRQAVADAQAAFRAGQADGASMRELVRLYLRAGLQTMRANDLLVRSPSLSREDSPDQE